MVKIYKPSEIEFGANGTNPIWTQPHCDTARRPSAESFGSFKSSSGRHSIKANMSIMQPHVNGGAPLIAGRIHRDTCSEHERLSCRADGRCHTPGHIRGSVW